MTNKKIKVDHINAVKELRLTMPHLKLANPYQYQRPDAYDIYMEKITGKPQYIQTPST